MSTGNINKKIIVKFVYFVQSAEKSGVHVQTATDSLCGSGGACAHVEFLENRLQMAFDRVGRDVKSAGDFFIFIAAR